jgi:hypothetical protein
MTRGKDDLMYAYCLVLDDIGTKAAVPPVPPSWILESSTENFQYGYLLEPIELTPEAMAHYDGCVAGLAQAGYSDPGARGAYRVMRLPGSLHKSGFVARITAWDPDRHYTLDELMGLMEVEPRKVRVSYTAPPRAGTAAVDDEVLQWLQEHNYVTGDSGDWITILCPWREEHSGGSDTAGYSRAPQRAFSCMHTHEYNTKDFLAWVVAQGGPDIATNPSFDLTKVPRMARSAL